MKDFEKLIVEDEEIESTIPYYLLQLPDKSWIKVDCYDNLIMEDENGN